MCNKGDCYFEFSTDVDPDVDERLSGQLLERCTNHLNFICVFTVVSNAFLALESTQYLCYDAIIVKDDLPNFGALELFKILKTVGANVGGIVLYNRERDIVKTLDESKGVRSFLPTPFSAFELGSAITTAIGCERLKSISLKSSNCFEFPANKMIMKTMPPFAFAPTFNYLQQQILSSFRKTAEVQQDISMTVGNRAQGDENFKSTSRQHNQPMHYGDNQNSANYLQERMFAQQMLGRKRNFESADVTIQRAAPENLRHVGKWTNSSENRIHNKRLKITSMTNYPQHLVPSIRHDSFDDDLTSSSSDSYMQDSEFSSPHHPADADASASDGPSLSSHGSFDSLSTCGSGDTMDVDDKNVRKRPSSDLHSSTLVTTTNTTTMSTTTTASYFDSEFQATLQLFVEDINDESLNSPYCFC